MDDKRRKPINFFNNLTLLIYWFIYLVFFCKFFLQMFEFMIFQFAHVLHFHPKKYIANISLNNFKRWHISSLRRRFGLQLEMCVRALIHNLWSNLWSERMLFDIFFFYSKIKLAISSYAFIVYYRNTKLTYFIFGYLL